MKTAEQWIEDLNAQEGAKENPCNIKPHEIRAIQADALLRAESIAHNTPSPENSTAFHLGCDDVARMIRAEAESLCGS